MSATDSRRGKYMFAVALSAIGAGLIVAWARRAILKIMSDIMQSMIAQMQEEGCDSAEI